MENKTMTDIFNPIMSDCPAEIYGTLIINKEVRGYNIVSFAFTLPHILSSLGSECIESMQSNGYLYYLAKFDDVQYDLRDKQQFLKLRDAVRNAYNNWVEFYKNKEKNKSVAGRQKRPKLAKNSI